MNPAPPVTTARTRRIVGAADVRHVRRASTAPARPPRRRCSPTGCAAEGREVRRDARARRHAARRARSASSLLHGPEMTRLGRGGAVRAARAEHVERVIRPALERGAWVVCDRYVDSSLVYQGIARGLGVERGARAERGVTGGLLPDRTFVLLLDAEAARSRQGRELDRIEREDERVPRRRRRRLPEARDAVPRAHRRRWTAARPPPRSPSRSVSRFEHAKEQYEAKRLLEAALVEGPVHAYLFHGPAGVGKRELARAFARELLGTTRLSHPGPVRGRRARRDDPDRHDPRAPARPPHAAVRGRPARVPAAQRRPDERGRRRRAAQGPRGAARLRRARARGG